MHNAHVNSLMRGRLGLYSQQPGQDAGVEARDQQFIQRGGYHQQERMIKDKRRSLDKATLYSYQAADVRDINAKILYLDKRAKNNKDLSVYFKHGRDD